jgi:hypothetical protein
VIVLTEPVLIEEVVTVETATLPPGAFRVEKVPTPAVIVPEEILETFKLDILARPAFIVDTFKELRFKLLPRAKVDIFSVEVVISFALKLDI